MKTFILLAIPLMATLASAALPADSIYNLKSEWTTQAEKKVHLEDFKGKYTLLTMVYMKCKYACPMTVARMKEIEKALLPEIQSQTQFVLVTFDIKKDTPKVLTNYAKKNYLDTTRWTFLTTQNESTVRELSALIDFKYKALPDGEFEHAYAIIALDKDGRIAGRIDGAEMNPKTLSDLLNKKP